MGNEKRIPTPQSAADIAKKAGVSLATVYNRAKKLRRLPTVEEAKMRESGRPRKYN